MSIAVQIDNLLGSFLEKTDGVLGSSVIISSQALVLAEVSSTFDRNVIEGMSSKILTLADETLKALLADSYSLSAITIEEEHHSIYVRTVSEEYYLVVITNSEEVAGLREMNIKWLISKLRKVLAS